MPVTTALLSRLRSLDDLHELVRELGYRGPGEELNAEARARLGLGPGCARAAILGRRDAFLVYGVVLGDVSRDAVDQLVFRLSAATPGQSGMTLVLGESGSTFAIAAASLDGSGPARQLRVDIGRPSKAAVEIVQRLAPREDELSLDLATRIARVLAEEGLTARFFREFTRMHSVAADTLSAMPSATVSQRRDLALVTLTRILFLYFVQAKGWLAGRCDFLPSLLDTALACGHPFHRRFFDPLCFGALASPRDGRRGAALALGEVPFLNGGLFERHPLERRFPHAFLPDGTWRRLFDELFERFHFTASEDEDAGAVNPEMLGRVFEGLMATERRRASGAYYTPRALLRRTVTVALDAALQGRAQERAADLRVLDPAVGSGAFLLEVMCQIEERILACRPGSSRGAVRRSIVRDCLFGVDADPMAVRLAELRLWLALVVDDDAGWEDVAPLPNLDQNLRQGDSLLSPLDLAHVRRLPGSAERLRRVAERRSEYYSATGSVKTRLASAIRREERELAAESTESAIASLTARLADATATGRDLFGGRQRRGAALRERVGTWRRERMELRVAHRRIVSEDSLPFFSFDVHFGDVLAAGGFHIVLGNPPWVRGERLAPSARRMLSRRYTTFRATSAGGGHPHLPDLSVAFVERAVQLAAPGGIVALIVPAKLLRTGYAAPLRALLRRTTTVLALDDHSHGTPAGFRATVFPLVLALRKASAAGDEPAHVMMRLSTGRLEGVARQRDVSLDESPTAASWPALPGDMVRAVRRALRAGPRLASVHPPRLGVKTGANAVFLRPAARADELPSSCRVPAIHGSDVTAFRLTPSSVMLAALDGSGTPLRTVPADVESYLSTHERVLSRRADAHGAPPWAVFRTDLARPGWFVVWPDIARRLEAATLRRCGAADPIPLNSCYGVTVPDDHTALWLAAYLNSPLVRAVAAALADRAAGRCFRFNAAAVGSLPLPPDTGSRAVASLADAGHAATHGGCDDDVLDDLAACALGLDALTRDTLRHLAATLCGIAGRCS